MFWRRSAFLVVLLATLFGVASVLPTEAAKVHRVEVQLLAVNDFHGVLDSGVSSGRPVGGAAVLTSYLSQWRHDAMQDGAESLIVGGGDLIGASPPVSGLLHDEPTIEALGLMGLKYSALGNHELNDGVTELLRLQNGGCHADGSCVTRSKFQYLAANVVYHDSGKPMLPPYAIEKIGGVRIGLIGISLRSTPTIVTPSGVAGIDFLDEAETVNRYTAELKRRGVETIVVLLHGGGEGDLEGGPVTGDVVPIVEAMDDEIDVVVTGHTETGFVGVVDGKLVTQAYSDGVAFADIDLVIDRDTGDVVSKQTRIVRTWADTFPGSTPAPRVQELVQAATNTVAPLIDRVVGAAAADITRVQTPAGESALGNLIADAQRAKGGTQLAFLNPGSMRADLAAGEVTWGELFATQPFGNDVIRMTLTGVQIERLLEQQWEGQPTPRVLQVSGISYTWSPSAPVGDRVALTDVLIGGAPLDLAAIYTVTTNSFIAAGGDNFTVLLEGAGREVVGGTDLDAFVEYVEALPQPFTARIEGRIDVR